VRHDEAADETGGDAPGGLPDVVELAFLALELDVERLSEVLAEVVAGAGLEGEAILHHGFYGVRSQGAGELFGAGFDTLDDGHGHNVFGHFGVDIEHADDLFQRFFMRGVGGVAFLPEELRGAEEHAGAQFPADDVGPLVEEHGQVPMALDPLGEEVADDGLRGGADDVGFFELLAAGMGDDGEFGREAFDVFGLLLQEALRNEQREIDVLVAGGFEAGVEFALEHFPDGVAVGLDDHAAFDDFGRLGHVALDDDVLIPGGEVFFAGSDG